MPITANLLQVSTSFQANPSLPNNSRGGNYGPYEYGGALYLAASMTVCPAVTSDVTTIYMGVYRSTDGGITWTAQDMTHAPVLPPTGGGFNSPLASMSYSCFYPKSGGKTIYFALLHADFTTGPNYFGPFELWSFDMSTNLWTQLATGSPNVYTYTQALCYLHMVRTSTGTFVIMYQSAGSNGVNAAVSGVTWDPIGGWGTPTVFNTESSSFGSGTVPAFIGITGCTDVVVMCYSSQAGDEIYQRTWSSGSFSAQSNALPWGISSHPAYGTHSNGYPGSDIPFRPYFSSGLQVYNTIGKFLASQNKLVWCVPFFNDATYPSGNVICDIYLIIADMSTSTPTFTTQAVALSAASGLYVSTDWCFNASESMFTAAWTSADAVKLSTASDIAGTWTTPTNYITGPSTTFDNLVSCNILSTGLGVAIGAVTLVAPCAYNISNSYFIAGTTPCPTGRINIAYLGD